MTSRRFRDALTDPAAAIHASAASVWEVAIKRALGKLPVPPDLFDQAAQAGCIALPVTWDHARAAETLPPHHADPFDCMLTAEARCEGLPILSADRQFAAYDVSLL